MGKLVDGLLTKCSFESKEPSSFTPCIYEGFRESFYKLERRVKCTLPPWYGKLVTMATSEWTIIHNNPLFHCDLYPHPQGREVLGIRSNQDFLSTFYVHGTLDFTTLPSFNLSSPTPLATALVSQEAQRGMVICPKTHSLEVTEL